MKLRSALLAATILAAPAAAIAQPTYADTRPSTLNGLYIGAGAGANFMHDQSIKSTIFPELSPAQFNAIRPVQKSLGDTLRLDTGFVGVVSVGYAIGNGLRIELEGSYRQNKFKRAGVVVGDNGVFDSGQFATAFSAGGDEMKYTGMVNVLYELPFDFVVQPYVGLGAGYSWVQHKNARFNGNSGRLSNAPNGINSLFRTNDADGAFAYQAIVGAAFPIGAIPGLALTAEYRFMGLVGERDYKYQYFTAAPNTATRANIKFDDNYNHSILLGVRYAFNAAPAPVIAPPPPVARREEARTYLVFFDWDRADLTDRARQIINEAAQATTRVAVTRIEVAGHTDKSGTPRYNQGLSQRRAQNVAAELVRLGVPRAAITTQAFGESRPLVQTADGVREPQNRRVEIVLR